MTNTEIELFTKDFSSLGEHLWQRLGLWVRIVFTLINSITLSNCVNYNTKEMTTVYQKSTTYKYFKYFQFYPPFFVVFLKVGKCIAQNELNLFPMWIVPNYKYGTSYGKYRAFCRAVDLRYDDSNTVCLVLSYHILPIS